MNKGSLVVCLVSFTFLFNIQIAAQTLPASYPILEEALRRQQLLGNIDPNLSFIIRPIHFNSKINKRLFGNSFIPDSLDIEKTTEQNQSNFKFEVLPFISTLGFNSRSPYGWGDGIMIPNVGFQNYYSTGIFTKFHFLSIQLQPEVVFAQNLPYSGFPDTFSDYVNRRRFFYWSNGDFPERFGEGSYKKFWWGQSKVSLEFGPIELSASSQNIWWGPGQFNALIFSNNAQGFPHLSLNSNRPFKTFIGNFEAQFLVGRLESSGLEPTQSSNQNLQYFRKLSTDWRYLNGFSISFQPKGIQSLFLGLNRTFQQYSEDKTNTFQGWFPIFEVFTKENFSENGTTMGYDSRGQDQQVSVFVRYFFSKANAEIYGEYGRRDHAYNLREFVLNPEHARAYLFGFTKIFDIPLNNYSHFQTRGEVTHQQESVNRYVRYPFLEGNQTWHTHGRARGFTHYGQALGVGTGVGSNVQTLEFSLVEKFNKMGILLERVANHQDFYYRAFGQQKERQPWVDLSLGLLFDHQWENLLVSSKLQFIHGLNYQWQLNSNSTSDFPSGDHKFAFMGQVHLIYLWNQKNKSEN